MKNSLTGNALKMYKAIEEAIWTYASDIPRERSGELADVEHKELLPGLLYYAIELSAGDDELILEELRKARLLYGADSAPTLVGEIAPAEAVGRTVASVTSGTVEGPYGSEPLITLHFTDGTRTGFVLPKDEQS